MGDPACQLCPEIVYFFKRREIRELLAMV